MMNGSLFYLIAPVLSSLHSSHSSYQCLLRYVLLEANVLINNNQQNQQRRLQESF